MNKHNIKINLMPRKSWFPRLRFLVVALFLLTALSVGVLTQSSAVKVRADSLPILVQVAHIDFGVVFPGEELVKYFSVQFLSEGEETIDYSIVEYPKPRPEFEGTLELTATEYCRQNPDDLENCYPDLCESLTEIIVGDEADTAAAASVGHDDLQDEWEIGLQAPAISGYAAQEHTFGLVKTAGEYGCDLAINIDSGNSGSSDTYCGDGIRQTPNDASLGGPVNDGYEQCDGSDGVLTGYVCTAQCVLEEEGNNGGGNTGGNTSFSSGGDYCGNGIKGADEQCDGSDGVLTGYVCNRSCQLEKQGNGQPSDEPGDEQGGSGGEEQETGGETQGLQDRLAVLPAVPQPVVAGQAEETSTPVEEFNVSDLKKVLGVETCQTCAWWVWLLVALLQVAGFVTYIYFVDTFKDKGKTQAAMFNGEQEMQAAQIKGSWAWWLPVLLLQAIVFVLLVWLCAIKWLPLAIILLAYYLMLVSYHAVLRNKKQWAKVLTAVLSVVPPIIVYVWCPWWTMWVWIVVLVLYVLTLLAYYLSLIRLKNNVYQWWMQAVFLMTLLMLVLEWVLHWCGCL